MCSVSFAWNIQCHWLIYTMLLGTCWIKPLSNSGISISCTIFLPPNDVSFEIILLNTLFIICGVSSEDILLSCHWVHVNRLINWFGYQTIILLIISQQNYWSRRYRLHVDQIIVMKPRHFSDRRLPYKWTRQINVINKTRHKMSERNIFIAILLKLGLVCLFLSLSWRTL